MGGRGVRYFCHIRDGDTLISDPEGDELSDDASAVMLARETTQEIYDMPFLYSASRRIHCALVVEDETGRQVAVVPFPVAKHLH